MTAVLLPNGKQQYFTTAGLPAVGYKVATFDAGTSNPRITWQDALKVAQNTNPVILDARGEASIFWEGAYKVQLQDSTGAVIWTQDGLQSQPNGFTSSLLPAVTNSVDIGSAAFTWRNGYFGTNVLLGAGNTPLLEISTGNIGYYARTAIEIAAGAVPVVFSYRPGHVNRYGAVADGVTDDYSAWQTAINVAQAGGCEVTWDAPKTVNTCYLIKSPLNCTNNGLANQQGLVFRGAASANMDFPVIKANHTGHVFDMTGAYRAYFENLSISTTGSSPLSCFFLSRNHANGAGNISQPSVGISRWVNCHVKGQYSIAIFYNYGSEQNVVQGCEFTNQSAAAGTKVAVISANNRFGLTSTYATVATGPQSCISNMFIGCDFYNNNSDAAADVFYFDHCASVKIIGGWFLCESSVPVAGRSIICVDASNGSTDYVSLIAMTGEQDAANQKFFIFGLGGPVTLTGWNIDACLMSNSQNAINLPANFTCDTWDIRLPVEPTSNGCVFQGTVNNSILHMGVGTLQILTAANKNTIIGFSERCTLPAGGMGTNFFIDQGTSGKTWVPALGTVAHGGVITMNEAKCIIIGNMLHFQFTMTDTVSITSTLAQTITGLPKLSVARSANVNVSNATTGAAIGTGFINAAANAINMPAFTTGAGVSVTVSGSYFF